MIVLGWALYALLKEVAGNAVLLALLCRVAEATLFGVVALIGFVVLDNYTNAAGGFDVAGRQALASLLSLGHSVSFNIAAIYFSLGSTIFFGLLFR
jgi:hypothetical protein